MNVLVIDDERNIRRMVRALLEEEGWVTWDASSAEEGLARIREGSSPDVILLDLALPGMSGLEALEPLQKDAPGAPIVMMSGEATLGDAVIATRRGAFQFLEKPVHPDALVATLRAALEVSRARDLAHALREELGEGTELVGRSEAMAQVRERIARVAGTDARVLVTGESGTGKELAATAIHSLSRRSRHPLVPVNSAAIPRELFESELFGHEKGAFTGAHQRRRGRFELAHRGTLFLDEVGELGLDAQAKLLRALESGTIQRVGGETPIAVDARIIAATNRDLRKAVDAGTFREDLLFRLDVVPIRMPPLRERKEDLAPLLLHAAERLRRRHGLPPPLLTSGALSRMQHYPWPGNVREVLNVMERLAILHAGTTVGEEEILRLLPDPTPSSATREGPRGLSERLEAVERRLIAEALEAAGGEVAQAARILETDRANLYRRMRRLGLRGD